MEPTKPTKTPFVGFVSARQTQIPQIQEVLT
jgi:hypothetical protein